MGLAHLGASENDENKTKINVFEGSSSFLNLSYPIGMTGIRTKVPSKRVARHRVRLNHPDRNYIIISIQRRELRTHAEDCAVATRNRGFIE